tara:strand:+ start:540 stop:1040 length:501 start_codon:yes stop_codon:yes gene_type:complete
MAKYRYNFTEDFQEKLKLFAIKHSNDYIDDFRINFESWCKENEDEITCQELILCRMGYNGDFSNKMFKSARYYLKNKKGDKKVAKERKKYTVKNDMLLCAIKEHIANLNNVMQPKLAYKDFMENNIDIIERVKDKLILNEDYDEKSALNKIKKIYKNKYFIIKKKN